MMMIDPKMMMNDLKMMMIDLNMMTIDLNMMMIDPNMMMIDLNMMTIDPTRCFYKILFADFLRLQAPRGYLGKIETIKRSSGKKVCLRHYIHAIGIKIKHHTKLRRGK